MRFRLRSSVTYLLAGAALTGCAGARVSTPSAILPVSDQRVVASATGQTIPFAAMADAVAKSDVVFFGEQHDDDETHRAELALLSAIGERRATVVLSLEMFERDVQPVLDAYLSGTLGEAEFRAQSRPWPNYQNDYRPLVELAKAKGWPVIAANVPRRLASAVSRRGLPAVDSLVSADRLLVARDIRCPQDTYYQNFMSVMGAGHGGTGGAASGARPMMDLFYEAQCVKDETMAESIVAARARAGNSAIVVHFNGAFHSDFGLGTASRVSRRLDGVKVVVVSAVPTPDPAKAKVAELLDRGQYILLARRTKP